MLLCPWDFPGKNTDGLPFPPPGDLPDPGIKPSSPALAGGFFTTEPPGNYHGLNLEPPPRPQFIGSDLFSQKILNQDLQNSS